MTATANLRAGPPARAQLFRFGVVGLATNALLYGLFVLLLRLGVDYRIAMTVAYTCGVGIGFVANGRWTFGVRDGRRFWRYVAAYALGYAVNLAGLALLVSAAAFAYESAQAVMVFVVAATLFLLQKHWVFERVDAG